MEKNCKSDHITERKQPGHPAAWRHHRRLLRHGNCPFSQRRVWTFDPSRREGDGKATEPFVSRTPNVNPEKTPGVLIRWAVVWVRRGQGGRKARWTHLGVSIGRAGPLGSTAAAPVAVRFDLISNGIHEIGILWTFSTAGERASILPDDICVYSEMEAAERMHRGVYRGVHIGLNKLFQLYFLRDVNLNLISEF